MIILSMLNALCYPSALSVLWFVCMMCATAGLGRWALPIVRIDGSNDRADCRFGSLPGWWDSSRGRGSRWRVMDSHCQLDELYQQYVFAGKNPLDLEQLPSRRLLFIGDSLDALVTEDFCQGANGIYRHNNQTMPAHSHSHAYKLNWCVAGPLILGQSPRRAQRRPVVVWRKWWIHQPHNCSSRCLV